MADTRIPDGVQAFSWLTLSLFERLYESFPEKHDIRSLRFVIETVVNHGQESDQTKWVRHLGASFSWLESEGFISVDGRGAGGDYLGVILTLKGSTALGYARDSMRLGWRGPMIKRIKSITRLGVSGASSKAAEVLLGKIFALAQGQ